MASEQNLDPEIVKKVCRVYFERYKKPADLLDILDYLNAEKVPPPPGSQEWDFFNIVPVIDLAPKICPEVIPAKGPKQGGTIILNIEGKVYSNEITDCSYSVSEDDFDVLELYGDSICIAAKITKEPISDAVVKQEDVSLLIGAELPLCDRSPSFGELFISSASFGKEKIVKGFLTVERAELFADVSKLYGGSDICLSGSINIVCQSGKTSHGTFSVNTQFNW